MFDWLLKLFVFALGAAAIGGIVSRHRIVAWLCGATLPILYELFQAVRDTGFAEPPENSHFWSHDFPLICAIGFLATMPGAFIGTLFGGWPERLREPANYPLAVDHVGPAPQTIPLFE
jgi:hypothetical protein